MKYTLYVQFLVYMKVVHTSSLLCDPFLTGLNTLASGHLDAIDEGEFVQSSIRVQWMNETACNLNQK